MKQAWENHGTKLLGCAIAGVGAFQIGLPQLQPHLTPLAYALVGIGTSVIVAVLGAFTVKRGFDNSSGKDDGA